MAELVYSFDRIPLTIEVREVNSMQESHKLLAVLDSGTGGPEFLILTRSLHDDYRDSLAPCRPIRTTREIYPQLLVFREKASDSDF